MSSLPASIRPGPAKNSFCSRSSSGIENSTAIRFGMAIRPFSVSATSQMRCSEPTARGDESAAVTLVSGDLGGIVKARRLSRATVRNIWQNLAFAFGYNALGIPVAAGVLYPFTGQLLSPVLAALAMSLSSISVISNALRLRGQ